MSPTLSSGDNSGGSFFSVITHSLYANVTPVVTLLLLGGSGLRTSLGAVMLFLFDMTTTLRGVHVRRLTRTGLEVRGCIVNTKHPLNLLLSRLVAVVLMGSASGCTFGRCIGVHDSGVTLRLLAASHLRFRPLRRLHVAGCGRVCFVVGFLTPRNSGLTLPHSVAERLRTGLQELSHS